MNAESTTPHVSIRRATDADASAITDVWLRSYDAALPSVRRAHSDDEVREHFRTVVVPRHESYVAVVDGGHGPGVAVGMMVLDGGEIDQLYVDPDWWGRGLGGRFVALAKERRPDGLALWTFQVNALAQRFYRRHGFVEVLRTDGRGNEELEPDIRYIWPRSRSGPSTPRRSVATSTAPYLLAGC